MGLIAAFSGIVKLAGATKFGKFCSRNASGILMGLGAISTGGTIISATIATKNSLDIIKKEKERIFEESKKLPEGNPVKPKTIDDIDLTVYEVINLCWEQWLVTAGFLVGSNVSFFGAYKLKSKECLGLATALTAANMQLASVEKQSILQLGEKKAALLQDNALRSTVEEVFEKKEKETLEPLQVGIANGLYYTADPISQQVWTSNKDRLELGIRASQDQYKKFGRIDLGDVLVNCGAKRPQFIGDHMEWKTREYYGYYDDNDVYDDELDIRVGLTTNKNGEPLYYLKYLTPPQWDDSVKNRITWSNEYIA